MGVISMKALLEAGVHFGHQTRRWNPKMAKYIYTSRNGIHIIDLQKTSDLIDIAYKALFEIGEQDGKVLFVGTKKQSTEPVREEAVRSGQYYVDKRWLGGTLTNFKTIKKSIKKLQDLYKMEKDGTFAVLPKKEVIGLRKEMDRLEKFLGGIKEMKNLPQAIFIIDPRKERNAILEARKLNIPVFGIVDTNCDPDEVDYIIPANDDALRSVKLIVSKMADALLEAKGGLSDAPAEGEEVKVVEEVKTVERPKRQENRPYQENRPQRTDRPYEKRVAPTPVAPVQSAPVQPAPVQAAPVQVAPVVKEVVKEVTPKPAVKATPDYESMTVKELQQIAKESNLTGYSAFKKAELIEFLKANQ